MDLPIKWLYQIIVLISIKIKTFYVQGSNRSYCLILSIIISNVARLDSSSALPFSETRCCGSWESSLCSFSQQNSPALELSGIRYLSSIPLGLREHLKGHAFDSISLSATARFSRGRPHCLRRFYHARTVTGRKYHYPLCWFWLSRSMPLRVEVLEACASASVAHNRKKVF